MLESEAEIMLQLLQPRNKTQAYDSKIAQTTNHSNPLHTKHLLHDPVHSSNTVSTQGGALDGPISSQLQLAQDGKDLSRWRTYE